MDAEIKQRWVAKLESGDYSQTTSKLADGTGYCCLGILCEIALEDGIVIKKDEGRHSEYVSKVDEGDYNSDVLPDAVVKWAGLSDPNPNVQGYSENYPEDEDDLASLNDNGMSFAEIAQLIDKNF